MGLLLPRRQLLKLAALTAPALILSKPSRAQLATPYNQAIYRQPYSAQSIWNAKPVSPTLGANVNTTGTFPISQGPYDILFTVASDPLCSITVNFIPDDFSFSRTVNLKLPPNAGPGSTTDGLLVIFDGTTNLIHEFFQLTKTGTNTFTATSYACSSAIPNNPVWYGGASQGLGIGTPARPVSGVSASGKSILSGVLRNWEWDQYINGGGILPKHPVYIFANNQQQVTANSSTSGPAPQFPATTQDAGFIYAGSGSGSGPLGSMVMLPSNFNLGSVTRPSSVALAQVLMTYGGYFMDSVAATMAFTVEQSFQPFYCNPFTNPVGIGPGWDTDTWTASNAGCTFSNTDIGAILNALQFVTSVTSWLDGNGNSFTPTPFSGMNLLPMRGAWTATSGSLAGGYFTERNAYVVTPGTAGFTAQCVFKTPYTPPPATGAWTAWNVNQTPNVGGFNGWYTSPTPGQQYTFTVYGTGNMTLQLLVYDQTLATLYYSGPVLGVGQSITFNWPNQSSTGTVLQLVNPASGGGAIRGELVAT